MISKELLSEVLKLKIHSAKYIYQTSILRFVFDAIGEERDSSINIYELAYKCKEWGNSYNAVIMSWCRGCPIEHKDELFHCEVYFAHLHDENDGDTFEVYSAPTEPEAIFKACQWVLETLRKVK